MFSWVNFYSSRLMRQGKGSNQEKNYSTFQCDDIVFCMLGKNNMNEAVSG